jgi:Ca2+/H+ antiporter
MLGVIAHKTGEPNDVFILAIGVTIIEVSLISSMILSITGAIS